MDEFISGDYDLLMDNLTRGDYDLVYQPKTTSLSWWTQVVVIIIFCLGLVVYVFGKFYGKIHLKIRVVATSLNFFFQFFFILF